jgi:D-alanine-D-alanine ligase
MICGREITVGVLDGTALPIIEIVPATTFYDYAAKYQRDDTRYVLDPDLPPKRSRCIQDAATTLCEVLGVGQLARVDFLLDNDDVWLLEVNTMPGFTSHSLLPMAAKAAGRPMSVLCEQLVLTAVRTAAGPAS